MQQVGQYYEVMSLDQIIYYLKDGAKSTYRARLVNTPTISNMIRGLQKLRQQLNKCSKKVSNEEQYAGIINDYNTVLQRINKSEALELEQKLHSNLTDLMRFYNNNIDSINKYFTNYVKDTFRGDAKGSVNKFTFWQKLQHCIKRAQITEQNLQNTNVLYQTVNKNKDEIDKLNRRIAQLEQNSMTDQKISEINKIYEKIMKGDKTTYRTFQKSSMSIYKIPFLQKIMDPICIDYDKIIAIEQKIRQLIRNDGTYQGYGLNDALTDKIAKCLNILSQKIKNNQHDQNQITNLNNRSPNKNNLNAHYQLNQKQINAIKRLKQLLIKGSFDKFNNEKIYLRLLNLPEDLLEVIESQQKNIQQFSKQLYKFIYGEENNFKEILMPNQQTLSRKCMSALQLLKSQIVSHYKELNKEVGIRIHDKQINMQCYLELVKEYRKIKESKDESFEQLEDSLIKNSSSVKEQPNINTNIQSEIESIKNDVIKEIQKIGKLGYNQFKDKINTAKKFKSIKNNSVQLYAHNVMYQTLLSFEKALQTQNKADVFSFVQQLTDNKAEYIQMQQKVKQYEGVKQKLEQSQLLIKAITETNIQLNQDIERLKQKIASLEKVKQYDTQQLIKSHGQLNDEIKRLQATNKSLKEEYNTINDQNIRISSTLLQQMNLNKQKVEQIGEINDRLIEANRQSEEKNTKMQQLQQEIGNLKHVQIVMNEQMQQYKKKQQEYLRQYQELKVKKQSSQAQISAKQQERRRKQNECNQQKSKIDNFIRQCFGLLNIQQQIQLEHERGLIEIINKVQTFMKCQQYINTIFQQCTKMNIYKLFQMSQDTMQAQFSGTELNQVQGKFKYITTILTSVGKSLQEQSKRNNTDKNTILIRSNDQINPKSANSVPQDSNKVKQLEEEMKEMKENMDGYRNTIEQLRSQKQDLQKKLEVQIAASKIEQDIIKQNTSMPSKPQNNFKKQYEQQQKYDKLQQEFNNITKINQNLNQQINQLKSTILTLESNNKELQQDWMYMNELYKVKENEMEENRKNSLIIPSSKQDKSINTEIQPQFNEQAQSKAQQQKHTNPSITKQQLQQKYHQLNQKYVIIVNKNQQKDAHIEEMKVQNEGLKKKLKQISQQSQARHQNQQDNNKQKVTASMQQKQDFNQLQKKLQNITKQIADNQIKLSNLLIEIGNTNTDNEIDQMKKEKDQLQKDLTNLKKQTQNERKKVDTARKDLRKIQDDAYKAKKAVKEHEAKLAELEKKKTNSENPVVKQKQQRKNEQKQKQKQKMEMEEQLKKLRDEIDIRKSQLSQIQQNIKQLTNKKTNLQEDCADKQREISKLQSDLKYISKMVKEQEGKLNKIKKQIEDSNRKKNQRQLSNTKSTINNNNKEIERDKRLQNMNANSQKQKQKLQLQAQLRKTKSEIKQLKDQKENKEKELKTINKQVEKQRKRTTNFSHISRLFIGEIFKNEVDRQFVIDEVQALHPNKQITRTKFLYSFKLMKAFNPHIFIDDVPNYIVIMTLENRDEEGRPYMLAMYSERALKTKDKINDGKGFISSVTNRKVFFLDKNPKNEPRVTEYYEYYITYGKGELQFKIGSDILELSIAHNYRSFNTGEYKTSEIFTGDNEEKTKIRDYQFYQIIFDKEEQQQ